MLFKFVSEQNSCGIASLQLTDLDANAVTHFLDHIEAVRSNSRATRNCRRAAIRGFFAEQLERNPRRFALNVSNVPGPREPVSVLSSPVRALYSLAEISQHSSDSAVAMFVLSTAAAAS